MFLTEKPYGNWYFDAVPMLLLLALVMLAEVRDIASYIYSNWTKVVLICHYVRHASSWKQSPWKKKLLGLVLRCKCKLLNHWEDRMDQCSVLALHPKTTPMGLIQHLIPLRDRTKVPREVKTAVLKALRSPGWSPSNGVASLCTRLHLQPLSASSGTQGVADIMLVAHIATSILEVRSVPRQPGSAHATAAMHLSRYCAYLVAYAPELLHDDDQWSKSLYKAVEKDAKRALVGVRGAWNPERLVQALSAGSEAHHVLKNGAELGKRLVELAADEGEEAAWEVLVDFWSNMILYAAPSDNVDAHAQAVARGGELITLLWALLTHLGVASRPEAAAPAAATPNAPGDV